jgi:hypothetical protein
MRMSVVPSPMIGYLIEMPRGSEAFTGGREIGKSIVVARLDVLRMATALGSAAACRQFVTWAAAYWVSSRHFNSDFLTGCYGM